MKFRDFKSIFADKPVFQSSYFYSLTDNPQVLKNQMSSWTADGLILRLRRGLYTLSEEERKIKLSRLFLASQLRFPSYISCQFALSYYGLIPEKTTVLTSVTTKKTAVYENAFGSFVYQKIKTDCFTGFNKINDEYNLPYFMAEPEKALLDYIYLNLQMFSDGNPDFFESSLRINKGFEFNIKKIKKYSELFKNRKLSAVCRDFLVFYEGEK